MTALRSIDVDFLTDAPVRLQRTATVRVPKSRLFSAIACEPAEWGHWCPGFTTSSRWTTSGPPGVGSKRTMRAFGSDFHETVLAFDHDARFTFRIDECAAPMVRAFLEDWTFESVDQNSTQTTRITWSMAGDSALPDALAGPFFKGFQNFLMKGAVKRLHRRYGDS